MNFLITSIQDIGIAEPILVRPIENTDEYEVISGHRRLHAAEKAGLETVPALIYAISRDEAAVMLVDSNLEEVRYKSLIADYEEEQRAVKEFVAESETEVQTAKEESVDLKVFLEAIRECTDITKLTPTLVHTLIKKIEVFNSVQGTDGKKHVPITVHFRAVGIITIGETI